MLRLWPRWPRLQSSPSSPPAASPRSTTSAFSRRFQWPAASSAEHSMKAGSLCKKFSWRLKEKRVKVATNVAARFQRACLHGLVIGHVKNVPPQKKTPMEHVDEHLQNGRYSHHCIGR